MIRNTGTSKVSSNYSFKIKKQNKKTTEKVTIHFEGLHFFTQVSPGSHNNILHFYPHSKKIDILFMNLRLLY